METVTEIVIADFAEGADRERLWQDISPSEQRILCEKLTDKAMAALGYKPKKDID